MRIRLFISRVFLNKRTFQSIFDFISNLLRHIPLVCLAVNPQRLRQTPSHIFIVHQDTILRKRSCRMIHAHHLVLRLKTPINGVLHLVDKRHLPILLSPVVLENHRNTFLLPHLSDLAPSVENSQTQLLYIVFHTKQV